MEVAVDHFSTPSYRRNSAKKLAGKFVGQRRCRPVASIYIGGLSFDASNPSRCLGHGLPWIRDGQDR